MKEQSIQFTLFIRSNKINKYQKPFFSKTKERFFFTGYFQNAERFDTKENSFFVNLKYDLSWLIPLLKNQDSANCQCYYSTVLQNWLQSKLR